MKVTLYDNVKIFAERNGLSILALERAVGLGRGSISKWETNMPSIDKVQKVASYFGVSTSELLGESSTSDPEAELNAYLDELKNDPEQKILFELAQGATKEQLQATVTFLRMLRGETDK